MSLSKDSSSDHVGTHDSTRGSTRALHLRGVDRLSKGSVDGSASTRRRPFSLERIAEDPRFHQLCLFAAKSLHQTQGVEFDEDYHISIDKDIEISVVELKLPLGCKWNMACPCPHVVVFIRSSLVMILSSTLLPYTFLYSGVSRKRMWMRCRQSRSAGERGAQWWSQSR